MIGAVSESLEKYSPTQRVWFLQLKSWSSQRQTSNGSWVVIEYKTMHPLNLTQSLGSLSQDLGWRWWCMGWGLQDVEDYSFNDCFQVLNKSKPSVNGPLGFTSAVNEELNELVIVQPVPPTEPWNLHGYQKFSVLHMYCGSSVTERSLAWPVGPSLISYPSLTEAPLFRKLEVKNSASAQSCLSLSLLPCPCCYKH